MEHICERPGELFIVSGPSGVGKGTICRRLIEEKKDIVLSVSATTRAQREGEVEGVNYYFMDKEDFEKIIAEDGFLEYAEVFGNYYGTPRKMVEEQLSQGNDVLLEIDVQGAMKVKEVCPEGIFIFILPPNLAELRNRLEKRGTDSQEVIEKRLSLAIEEIRQMFGYDYFVVNDDLEEAVAKVHDIVSAEHARVQDHGLELLRIYEEEQ